MEKNQRLDLQQLPPGFRFHPSDEELIVHYLRKKVTKSPLPASIVADVELYKYNPWDLPKKSATYGDEEWYFFTPRERKYPNGTRPKRMAASGYWKAVGVDKPILSYCGSKVIGVKKALVFYIGRPPKGSKTDWIMQEYRVPELEVPWSNHREKSMTLDDWVLCRVSQKICMPGSICEERNGPTPCREPLQFLPKMNREYVHVEDEETTKRQSHLVNSSAIHETLPVPADNPEMITDYFRNEGPMFPLVLLANNPPQENNYPSMDSVNSCLSYETTTTTTNNNNNKSTQSSVSEEKFNLNYLRTLVANMVKRKLPLESGHDDDDEEMDFKNPNKKAAKNNNNANPNVNGMASYSNITTTTQMEKNNNYNYGEQMGPTMYHDLYRLAFYDQTKKP